MTTRVQLQPKLAKLSFCDQAMSEYIGSFEEVFDWLAAMGTAVSEEMKVATLLSSFGEKLRSPYGHTLASLQTFDDTLNWEAVTARLLQEYEERSALSIKSSGSPQDHALTVQSTRGKFERTYGPPESRTCYRCNQPGNLARQCPQKHTTQYRGRHTFRGDHNQKHNANGRAKHAKVLRAMSQEHREEKQTFIVDSGASDHMVNKLKILTNVRDINAKTIELGNGFKVVAHRMGELLFNAEVKNGKEPVFRTVVFKDVLFIPELNTKLV